MEVSIPCVRHFGFTTPFMSNLWSSMSSTSSLFEKAYALLAPSCSCSRYFSVVSGRGHWDLG